MANKSEYWTFAAFFLLLPGMLTVAIHHHLITFLSPNGAWYVLGLVEGFVFAAFTSYHIIKKEARSRGMLSNNPMDVVTWFETGLGGGFLLLFAQGTVTGAIVLMFGK